MESVDEDLTPEEERAMQLECENTHLKRKLGADWMKSHIFIMYFSNGWAIHPPNVFRRLRNY